MLRVLQDSNDNTYRKQIKQRAFGHIVCDHEHRPSVASL